MGLNSACRFFQPVGGSAEKTLPHTTVATSATAGAGQGGRQTQGDAQGVGLRNEGLKLRQGGLTGQLTGQVKGQITGQFTGQQFSVQDKKPG